MKRSSAVLVLLACWMALMTAPLGASMLRGGGGHDHVGFGDTITINEGDSASDIVCAFCTVRVNGDVNGDLVTFFGRVEVGDGRGIHGDAVVFGGELALGNESSVAGDLVLFGGDLVQAATATIHGSHVVFSGGGWLLALLLPLLIPIGIIWLIVRLVFRRRYQFPAYPGGRRY